MLGRWMSSGANVPTSTISSTWGGREGRRERRREGGRGRDGERKVGTERGRREGWGDESREGKERKKEKKEGERLTSAMVTLAAFAMGTLKFLADFLKTRFPLLSAFHALMRAKSAKMASSMM